MRLDFRVQVSGDVYELGITLDLENSRWSAIDAVVERSVSQFYANVITAERAKQTSVKSIDDDLADAPLVSLDDVLAAAGVSFDADVISFDADGNPI